MHCERHVFPLASSTELDQRIRSLLELYERKLPYLMRNPDVVFQTLEHLETDNMVQNQIITGINKALRLEDESEEDVNDFIEKILTAFNKFKQQNKESK
jgi:ABC-type ATPase involved in cell division